MFHGTSGPNVIPSSFGVLIKSEISLDCLRPAHNKQLHWSTIELANAKRFQGVEVGAI